MLAFLLNRYTWIAAAMLVLAVGGFGFGVKWESNRRDAQLLKAERAERDATERLRAEWDRSNAELSAALARANVRNRDLERQINEGILHVKTSNLVHVEQPAASGDPAVRFTPAFVGLYNRAVTRVPETAPGADGAGAASSSADPRDLLVNINVNGAEFETCRSQLKAWQDWARASGLAR